MVGAQPKHGASPLDVVDEIGIRTILAPGRRLAVAGPITVVAEGATRRHALHVEAGSKRVGVPIEAPVDARPTSTADKVVINDQDRLALVALFAGYLERSPATTPTPAVTRTPPAGWAGRVAPPAIAPP